MIANWLISRATGVKLHDYGCSLKVFRAEVVKSMKLYGEMHRFLPAIASEFGVDIVEHVVNHRARVHGTSKYGISRTDSRRPRPADGQVPHQLLDAAGADLRPARARHGIARRRCVLAWLAYVKYVQHEGIADRPLLLFGILLVS